MGHLNSGEGPADADLPASPSPPEEPDLCGPGMASSSSSSSRSVSTDDDSFSLDRLITSGLCLSRDETLAMRQQHIPAACVLHFERSPMKVSRAQGQYLYDDVGMEYLDCVNCVAHVGHCHPSVVSAGRRAMLETGSVRMGQCPLGLEYVQKLKTTLPPELDTFLFVSSASEGNDLALQLARLATGGTDVVAVERSFHGSLSLTSEISPRILCQGPGSVPDWVHIIQCPDLYHGRYWDNDSMAVYKYCEDAGAVIKGVAKKGRKLCCYIGEPIMTIAGIIIPPTEWTKSIYQEVRAQGGVVIADEAQSGLGRCGESWWAFQSQGVVPDIVTIGKPLGNGHPMAVVVTTSQIASHLGEERLSGFSCDPVTASIGIAVIRALRAENLQLNARNVGSFLREGLRALTHEHQNIGDVRGIGLMVGVEIVYNRETRKSAKDLAEQICYMMKENNIIMANDGINKNVLIMIPPMCFNCENAHRVIMTLDKILHQIEQEAESAQPGPSTSTSIMNYMHLQPGPSTSAAGLLTRSRLISTDVLFSDPDCKVTLEDLNFDFDTPTASTSAYLEMD